MADVKKENRRSFVKYVLTGIGVVGAALAYLLFSRIPFSGKSMSSQTFSTAKSRIPPGQRQVED